MKFMTRLSQAVESSNYSLLRSESMLVRNKKKESSTVRNRRISAVVPEGHLPVFVGEEMERFVVSAKLLNHPIILELLDKSAQVYGYKQKGVLRIPCHVFFFERVLEAVRLGDAYSGDLQDLLDSSLCDQIIIKN